MASFKALLLVFLIMQGCGKSESTASKYIKSRDSLPATKEPTPNPNPNPNPNPKPPYAGDAEKGRTQLMTCSGCHNGAEGKTKLDASVIESKLDAAYAGANSAMHSSYESAFEGDGRKDLEAALKEIE